MKPNISCGCWNSF